MVAWWDRRRRSPGTSLVVAAHLHLALVALAIAVALAMPAHGVFPATAGDAVAFRFADGNEITVARDDQVVVLSDIGSLAARAREFVPDYMPSGDRRAIARFYADRDRLAVIAAESGARIRFRGGSEPLRAGSRGLADLPPDFWLLCFQGVAIGLLGWWLRLTGPVTMGARMFSLSCDGVLLAAMSGAVFDARALTADGNLLWSMQIVNQVGTNLCAAGLMALFFYLPRPLARPWFGTAAIAVAVLLGIAEGFGFVSLTWFYLLLIVPNAALLMAGVMQWRAAAGDPKARAIIRLVGTSTFAGGALVCCGMVVPQLFGLPPFASDGATILPLALIYGSIAFGVAGTRLFVLDVWSYRLAVGTATVLLLLAADALIANLLHLQGPVALAIALLAMGYAYLPLRSWAWRWITGARSLPRDSLVRQAALVAFAPARQARDAGWRALLERVFAPLEITPAGATDQVRIEAAGEVLRFPATADSEALSLRYARRGTRLFSPADVDVGRELVSLLREASAARASYATGVYEERRRIARDLHDDVSGLLLSGLHRGEIEQIRDDVQQAMNEIRTIVSSLADGDKPLDDVLADIRHEAAVRLDAVRIDLSWNLLPEARGTIVLDYARVRTLTAAMRELVTNAIKHAPATRFIVEVACDDEALTLVVTDNGGAAPVTTQRARSGRGLANIAQRVEEIGGRCHLEPRAGGFLTLITIPLAPGRPEAPVPLP